MECREVEFMLFSCEKPSEVAEGHTQLKEHLDGCQTCKKKYDEAGRLNELLVLKAEERPPSEYWANFSGQLENAIHCAETESKAPVVPHGNNLRWLGVAVAACVGALISAGVIWGTLVLPMRKVIDNNTRSLAQPTGKNDTAQPVAVNGKLAKVDNSAMKEQDIVFARLQKDFSGEVVWMASEGDNTELGWNAKPVHGPRVSVMVELYEIGKDKGKRLVSSPLLTVVEKHDADVSLPLKEMTGSHLRLRCRPTLLSGENIRLDFEVYLMDQPGKSNGYKGRMAGFFSSLRAVNGKSTYAGQFVRDGKRYDVYIRAYQQGKTASRKEVRADI